MERATCRSERSRVAAVFQANVDNFPLPRRLMFFLIFSCIFVISLYICIVFIVRHSVLLCRARYKCLYYYNLPQLLGSLSVKQSVRSLQSIAALSTHQRPLLHSFSIGSQNLPVILDQKKETDNKQSKKQTVDRGVSNRVRRKHTFWSQNSKVVWALGSILPVMVTQGHSGWGKLTLSSNSHARQLRVRENLRCHATVTQGHSGWGKRWNDPMLVCRKS